jgi:hypothetical protein
LGGALRSSFAGTLRVVAAAAEGLATGFFAAAAKVAQARATDRKNANDMNR